MINKWAVTGGATARCPLVLFLACFFTSAFASQRFFNTLFLAGFQIEGMTFYFFDNVFLLYLALKRRRVLLKGFTLLKAYFSQTDCTPKLVPLGRQQLLQGSVGKSSDMSGFCTGIVGKTR
jgi:hypothetical protein